MASQTSDPERPVPLAIFAADIERRRQAASVTDVPRNAGDRRTESKRALLAAIEQAGGRW
jgi:hypothetical protein